MTFHEKSAITMAGILAVVYGGYFAVMLRWLTDTRAEDIPYQPLMAIAVIPLAVLAALSHIVLAVADPKAANSFDERDRQIALRSERLSGYVLAVGVFASLVLAMAEVPHFFIAHALMLMWVVAQITEEGSKVMLYRRGI